jgi:hypothetical protein
MRPLPRRGALSRVCAWRRLWPYWTNKWQKRGAAGGNCRKKWRAAAGLPEAKEVCFFKKELENFALVANTVDAGAAMRSDHSGAGPLAKDFANRAKNLVGFVSCSINRLHV